MSHAEHQGQPADDGADLAVYGDLHDLGLRRGREVVQIAHVEGGVVEGCLLTNGAQRDTLVWETLYIEGVKWLISDS